jgi:diaminopimelate epimerase
VEIPFVAEKDVLNHAVEVNEQTVMLSVASMGNPHAVIRVKDVAAAPVTTLGAVLERHARFPERVNVGFLEITGKQTAKLRVFERGTGETLACGTGACAAAVTGIRQGWLSSPVRICQAGGDLEISWEGEGKPVYMRGPTAHVFEGVLQLDGVATPPAVKPAHKPRWRGGRLYKKKQRKQEYR